MADKRISELQPLAAAGVQGDTDVLAIADISAAETKKITLGDAVAAGLQGGIPDGTIPGDKIEIGSISGDRLEENAITGRELAPDSVDTIHIKDSAVTNAKLAGGITGDKLVDGTIGGTQLEPKSVDGQVHIKDKSINGGQIQANSLSSDELADNSVGTAELQSDSVDSDAVKTNALETRHYTNGSITNEKLASGIDGAKLLDSSVDADAIKTDALITRHYSDSSVTNAKLADGIDGGKILNGSITGDKLSGSIDGSQIDSITLDKLPNAPANNVLAGPTTGGAASPNYRKLIAADLPNATTTDKGAVSVPADGGLSLTGTGVGISNTVTPGGFPFVNFNKHGSITSGRALSGSDLPPPAAGQPGAVKAGDGLAVTGDGTLNVIPATETEIGGVIEGDGITIAPDGKISQTKTGIAAGTYTKLTVDEMGNATVGEQLTSSDLPSINWDQINNPNVDGDMLADKSVNRRHLNDFATMYIQEVAPTVDSTTYVGAMWFRESVAGLSAWNGNSWMSIGQGRLSAENLRYSGIFAADTGLITGLTQFGVGEGYEIGTAIPAASDLQTGVYFVAQVPGDGTTVTPGVSYDAGDWILCNGAAGGWVRIDTMVGGGGGGGGAANLADLLDVSIGSATTGAFLQLQASGQWADTYGIDGGEY